MTRLIPIQRPHRRFWSSFGLAAAVLLPMGAGAWESARAPAAAEPITTNRRFAPPPWAGQAGKLLKKNSDGTWMIPWDAIKAWVENPANLTPLPNLGETNHLLLPIENSIPVRASIVPFRQSQGQQENDLAGGQVIAKIVSGLSYARLGLVQGDNYLMVFKAPVFFGFFKEWRLVTVNGKDRKKLRKFDYKPHGDLRSGRTAALTPGALTCAVNNNLKACFVDSKEIQIMPPPGAQNGAGLYGAGLLWVRLKSLFRNGGESQPWVACTQYGCCCGGENCHPT